jgi:hypothetical protein
MHSRGKAASSCQGAGDATSQHKQQCRTCTAGAKRHKATCQGTHQHSKSHSNSNQVWSMDWPPSSHSFDTYCTNCTSAPGAAAVSYLHDIALHQLARNLYVCSAAPPRTCLGRQRPSSVSHTGRSLGQQCCLSAQQVASTMGQQPQLKQKPAMSLWVWVCVIVCVCVGGRGARRPKLSSR